MIQTSSIANLRNMKQNEIWLVVRSVGKAKDLLKRPTFVTYRNCPRRPICSTNTCAGNKTDCGIRNASTNTAS